MLNEPLHQAYNISDPRQDKLISLLRAHLGTGADPQAVTDWIWNQEPSFTHTEKVYLTVLVGTLIAT